MLRVEISYIFFCLPHDSVSSHDSLALSAWSVNPDWLITFNHTFFFSFHNHTFLLILLLLLFQNSSESMFFKMSHTVTSLSLPLYEAPPVFESMWEKPFHECIQGMTMCGWTDRWKDRWLDEWMGRRMDNDWMDGYTFYILVFPMRCPFPY